MVIDMTEKKRITLPLTEELAKAVEKALGTDGVDTSAALLANERQRLCCQRAVDCLTEAVRIRVIFKGIRN